MAFSYSRKLGTGRLENLKIVLPVTDSGQPDYDFMESFGRKLMANKYHQYLRFLKWNDLPSVRTIPLKLNDTPL